MGGLPFEPAPVVVEIESPLAVDDARAALAAGLGRRRLVQPAAGERFAVGVEGEAAGSVVQARGTRYLAPGLVSRSSSPVAFEGGLRAVDGGSRLDGAIVAPLSRLLWLLPTLALVLGLVATPWVGLAGPIAGVLVAAAAVGIFGLMQRESLSDAPQLVRGLTELLNGEPLDTPRVADR